MSDIRTQALMFTQQLSYLPKVSEFIKKVKQVTKIYLTICVLSLIQDCSMYLAEPEL